MDVKESNSEVEALFTKLTAMKKELEHANENTLLLLERRLLILLNLKQFSTAIEEGLRALEKLGPHPLVYKCILAALCRTNQFDKCFQLLDQWKRLSPIDSTYQDTLHAIESFITSVRNPGLDPGGNLILLEKSLGLTEEWVYKNCDESNWRFRAPPRQHSSKYTLCPALVGCFYGDDCPSAHSIEELNEWNFRMDSIGNNFFNMNTNSKLDPVGTAKYRGNFGSTRGPRLINGLSNGGNHHQAGLFTTTQTFQFSNGRTVTTNCYTNENCLNQNCPVSANIPYLIDLIHKYQNTTDLTSLFAIDLEDVKFKSFSPLSIRTKTNQHQWSFAIASREALRTVSLLHDEHRLHFYILDGTFYYGPRPINLKNLHAPNRNTHLQVLNTFIPSDIIKDYGGWPTWFYYKIEVGFRGEVPGDYKQAIVFDFKKDPKLIKQINMTLEANEVEQLPPTKAQVSLENSSGVQVVVVDSNSGFPVLNRGWPNSNSGQIGRTQTTHLNKLNYVQEMTKLLGHELSSRQAELRKLDLFQDLMPTNMSVVDGDEIAGSQLFCTIYLGSSLREDSPVGKIIQRSCQQVLLTSSDYPSRSYMCGITEKHKSNIIIALGKAIVQDLALRMNTTYNFKVELTLDVSYFDKMKRALNSVSEVELEFLFPNLTEGVIFENDHFSVFVDCIGAFTLNQRQLSAYTAITNSPIVRTPVPPILLIGPFGTGKTYTLCESVRKVIRANPISRVLICTHSNSAADIYVTNIHEWKLQDYRPLRVYFHDRRVHTVSNIVKQYCTFDQAGKFRYPTKEEVCNHRIIVTTLSTSPELLRIGIGKSFFTHIIIDEAAQVLETEAIEPILLANPNTRIVIAGDHMQLSPDLFGSQAACTNVLGRLSLIYPDNHPCKIILNENYRTHEQILKFASLHFYSDSIWCSTIQPTHPHLSPLTFFSVRGEEALGVTSFYNSSEIQELGTRLDLLIRYWPPQWGDVEDSSAIVILTPYTEQVQRIRAHLRLRNLSHVSVETVENVQGKQFRAVFISTVRTMVSTNDPNLDLGFLSCTKMFNTALSRSQSLVAVVGDPVSLCSTGKCRQIWMAFIQEAMQHNSLHGIHFDQLKNTLAELGCLAEIKSKVNVPVSQYTTNYQIRPSASPNFPVVESATSHNFSVPNFGPSLLSNSLVVHHDIGNVGIPSQGRLGMFAPFSDTSSFGVNQLGGSFNELSVSSTVRRPSFENSKPQNTSGLNHSSFGRFTPPQVARFGENLNTSYNFPIGTQASVPISVNGSVLNNAAKSAHPPGFPDRSPIINMQTFEQNFLNPVGTIPEPSAGKETNNFNNLNPKTITSQKDLQTGNISANIVNGYNKGIKIEKGMGSGSSSSNSSVASPTLIFPLDEYPTLDPVPPKKSTDWIEVKPKKPKPATNNVSNGKQKNGAAKPKTVEEKIGILTSMGFDKKRSIKALQLSDRDLEKATELLLSGTGIGKDKTVAKD